jgi:Mn2+/Fe2+ NRAMP family transporter
MNLRNNRPLTIASAIIICVLILFIFNPNNILTMVSILQSLAITALAVVATIYLAKRI